MPCRAAFPSRLQITVTADVALELAGTRAAEVACKIEHLHMHERAEQPVL